MMLLKRHVSPVFFKNQEKNEYKEALKIADTTGLYELLYERFFKSILNSFAELSDFTMQYKEEYLCFIERKETQVFF